ncbi:Protein DETOXIFICATION [Seminavis robusta]|uniref:Protein DETOXIFICATION n=1 Tax=Seminavis robusta TaxID=568900 RepID=A0A9N8E7I7_9STRA|nr:Protein DETOXIFICATION [Seminavis robusta]|eukprot:Sro596_g172780.1 Protein DETOXIFICATION (562) ;mRNA; r:18481-20270
MLFLSVESSVSLSARPLPCISRVSSWSIHSGRYRYDHSKYSKTCSRLNAAANDENDSSNEEENINLDPSSSMEELQNQPSQPASPKSTTSSSSSEKPQASKRKMLSFAIPALGIFLCNPLLSNIDNAFVGKTVGTQGLAALSPATICTDQMLYLFSFLGRATTGLVSRAYKYDDETGQGDKQAAREAASSPLSVALIAGVIVTTIYAFFTQQMLSAINIAPSLRAPAASYIRWRGAIAWAAMAQNVILNILLASRDAITPLKIVLLAAVVNVVGDALCCVWPLQMGCGGAAAATAFATLFSSFFMIRSLKRKELLPRLKIPTKQQLLGLLEFTGPLLAITLTRLLGAINMQRAASRLGVNHLAAYQMSINIMFLFMLFGEPLSQLSQTQLPALVDDKTKPRGPLIQATLKSILTLGAMTAVAMGGIAALLLRFGSGLFSSDAAVQQLANGVAPSLFLAVATGIFTVAVDGSMLASRDFGFMLFQGTLSLLVQWKLLLSPWCSSVSAVFATFTLRLGTYALFAVIRVALGRGPLGKALRRRNMDDVMINGDEINGASSAAAA